MPGTQRQSQWLFLGVLVMELTAPGAPVTVAEAIVPEGPARRRTCTPSWTTASTSLTAAWSSAAAMTCGKPGPKLGAVPGRRPTPSGCSGGRPGSCWHTPTTPSWPRCARSAARPRAPTPRMPHPGRPSPNSTGPSPPTASPTSARRWNRTRPNPTSANWPERLAPTDSTSSKDQSRRVQPGSPLTSCRIQRQWPLPGRLPQASTEPATDLRDTAG